MTNFLPLDINSFTMEKPGIGVGFEDNIERKGTHGQV